MTHRRIPTWFYLLVVAVGVAAIVLIERAL